jgi:hypothetical protein
VERWFSPTSSYRIQLDQLLKPHQVQQIAQLFQQHQGERIPQELRHQLCMAKQQQAPAMPGQNHREPRLA